MEKIVQKIVWKNIKTKKQTKEEYNEISLDSLHEYLVPLNALRKINSVADPQCFNLKGICKWMKCQEIVCERYNA
jgi:hypothetical protein